MRKKINLVINGIIYSVILLFISQLIETFIDYKIHPNLYATYSAPWYLGILIKGFVALFAIITAFIVKLIVKKFI